MITMNKINHRARKQRGRTAGFSLVEITLVVFVMSVLAAITVPNVMLTVSNVKLRGTAADLAGLPPTYISCGALDLFADENMQYARRLVAAGVPTELHIYPGAFHGYEFAAQARVSIASEGERRVALARAFGISLGAEVNA